MYYLYILYNINTIQYINTKFYISKTLSFLVKFILITYRIRQILSEWYSMIIQVSRQIFLRQVYFCWKYRNPASILRKENNSNSLNHSTPYIVYIIYIHENSFQNHLAKKNQSQSQKKKFHYFKLSIGCYQWYQIAYNIFTSISIIFLLFIFFSINALNLLFKNSLIL